MNSLQNLIFRHFIPNEDVIKRKVLHEPIRCKNMQNWKVKMNAFNHVYKFWKGHYTQIKGKTCSNIRTYFNSSILQKYRCLACFKSTFIKQGWHLTPSTHYKTSAPPPLFPGLDVLESSMKRHWNTTCFMPDRCTLYKSLRCELRTYQIYCE